MPNIEHLSTAPRNLAHCPHLGRRWPLYQPGPPTPYTAVVLRLYRWSPGPTEPARRHSPRASSSCYFQAFVIISSILLHPPSRRHPPGNNFASVIDLYCFGRPSFCASHCVLPFHNQLSDCFVLYYLPSIAELLAPEAPTPRTIRFGHHHDSLWKLCLSKFHRSTSHPFISSCTPAQTPSSAAIANGLAASNMARVPSTPPWDLVARNSNSNSPAPSRRNPRDSRSSRCSSSILASPCRPSRQVCHNYLNSRFSSSIRGSLARHSLNRATRLGLFLRCRRFPRNISSSFSNSNSNYSSRNRNLSLHFQPLSPLDLLRPLQSSLLLLRRLR